LKYQAGYLVIGDQYEYTCMKFTQKASTQNLRSKFSKAIKYEEVNQILCSV